MSWRKQPVQCCTRYPEARYCTALISALILTPDPGRLPPYFTRSPQQEIIDYNIMGPDSRLTRR
ncbi:hypothetical protein SCLCIDRAFT_1219033 [Scleroderma citrinum Foug A]|uniref:Uncharacterized protein n=1 Tax=Scleroderma citrinum Foug A TaxID=1036808 RepID=A0A0C2ZZW4_9AGAM|nr:hypothetical protein SCLCIDRAFT_1219033 [Scleroderma citrinum Foug A]